MLMMQLIPINVINGQNTVEFMCTPSMILMVVFGKSSNIINIKNKIEIKLMVNNTMT